ncbi:hypothetical protein T484DRAFT_3113143, partial [Baffinella frigidus]
LSWSRGEISSQHHTHLPPRISRLALLTANGAQHPPVHPPHTQDLKMTYHEFARLASVERRIAREARLDAVLSKDFEPASFTFSTSATQDAPEAAHNEEVLAEKILHHSITRLSLIFQSDELSDIVAASAAPPPPLRTSSRGATLAGICSSTEGEQDTEGLPDARRAWGALAQRFKLARPAPPSPNAAAAALSPAASCARVASSFSIFCKAMDDDESASACDTFRRRFSMPMPVKAQPAVTPVGGSCAILHECEIQGGGGGGGGGGVRGYIK